MKERLHKYMARCGVASRRKSEEMVFAGRVKVNAKQVSEIVIVDDEIDKVEVDDVVIFPEENKVYVMINKPTDIITSVKDQFGRKTVLDFIDVKERVFPVGRLDYDTSGLLILTNDGEITYKLSHPSHEISKVYDAEALGKFTETEIEEFQAGLQIEDFLTSPAKIEILSVQKDISNVRITIHEGRNRQVRKMCEKVGHPVIKLKRIKFGEVEIGSLKPGEWRFLTDDEIEYIKTI
jgi:23S rRNA pseudouridine2605 synthase